MARLPRLPLSVSFTAVALAYMAIAGALVLQAMGLDPQPVLEQRTQLSGITPPPDLLGAGTGTYSIDSHARLADGREAVLRAVVRVGGGAPGTAYTPLFWNEGVSVSEPQSSP